MDLRWAQRAAWRSRPNSRPFFFIGSENDVDLEVWHGEDPLGAIHRHYSDVRRIEMLPHAGHMIQLERPAEVGRLMVEYLASLS